MNTEGTTMNTHTKPIGWMTLSCAIAMLVGTPAIADDTELLLVVPDPNNIPKPNVMFILDTSGSMTTIENTGIPYDSNNSYPGNCDENNFYWSDVGVEPTCDGTNTRYIDKSSFHCDAATNQINGIGNFASIMVQYRSDAGGAATWTTLEDGNSSDAVECFADSGVHGDGMAGFVYADSGSGLSYAWTTDPLAEVAWDSAPRNTSYTVYDGKFLNWRASPASIDLSRTEIMKSVTKKVLNSVNDMNVGIMRFNDSDGGPVIKAMTDLNSDRLAILNIIDSLPADGATPLSETMYENALYWLGEPAYYGEKINETPTDPAALSSVTPEIYSRPNADACAKNYNVLLTDGKPVNDEEAETLTPTLPNFSTVLNGRTTCTFNAMGDCLDDTTEYLSLVDTNPGSAGIQNVTTHTIGFTIDLPILRDAAVNSGGQYFLADDVDSLTAALLDIVANINNRALSFSAPAVSVNTFNRTQNLNELYLTVFGAEAKSHWPGNLKKFKVVDRVISDANGVSAVNPATGFFNVGSLSYWTDPANGPDGNDVRLGGAANRLPDPAVRNVYTNNVSNDITHAGNLVTPSNVSAFSDADFGLTGSAGEPTRDEIIRWMRGEDIQDEDDDVTTTIRYAMGDPLHSQPAAIVYGGTPASPDAVVYSATNDGFLHAIDTVTGAELWSFVPKDLLQIQNRLFFNLDANFKSYGLDGNVLPIVKDDNKNGIVDGADFVVLVFGMRRGGSDYYALDVTDKNTPRLLWKTSLTDAGQSWSTPVPTKIEISGANQNADNAVLVIGGGYDPVHDTQAHPSNPDGQGAGIHILDLMSGATLWRGGPDGAANKQFTGMTRAMPNEIRVIDVNGDQRADRMYASDLGGQVWRFDILNGQPAGSLVNGGVIAQLGGEGLGSPAVAETRRFYNAPDVSLFNDVVHDKRYIAVSIGSGYRAHPLNTATADRFFSIRDPDIFNVLSQVEYDTYQIVTANDLIEVSGQKQVVISQNDRGWKFTLPANQMILADSVTFDDSVFFVAFSPNSAPTSCSAGTGTNYLYRVSILNGDPVVNNLDTLDPTDADDARRQTLAQGGIAPTPTILFPSPDAGCTGAACSPPPIGCVGVECFDPGFINNPVRTLWTQDGIE